MSTYLEQNINQPVQVITTEGRVFQGILTSYDNNINIVLNNTHERIYQAKHSKKEKLGLYLIKGDNISIISRISDNKFTEDISNLSSSPIKNFNLND